MIEVLLFMLAAHASASSSLATGVGCGNSPITWNGSIYTCTDFNLIYSSGPIPVSSVDLSTVTTALNLKASTGVVANVDVRATSAMKQADYVLKISSQNAGFMVGVKSNGALTLTGRTIVQLLLDVPAVGDTFYCSNCVPKKVVVGTGTSAGNWADMLGGVFK